MVLVRLGIDNQLEWWVPECRRIIDIAILSNKIAIEVDGSSHEGMLKQQKQTDDKLKDQQLQFLRFTNEEIQNYFEKVIKIIKQVQEKV